MSSSIARSAQHILSHTPVSSKVVKVHRNKSHFDEGNTVVESNENTEDVSDASSSTKLSASTNIKFSREFSVKENLLNSKSTTSVLPAIINESPRSARSIDEQTISPRVQLPSIVHISINGSMSGLQDLEKKELQEALEILMMQNKMLASRIEKSQIESQQQLETEKRKRLADVSRLSDEKSVLNRQLMEAQEVAEKRLEKEKEELLMVIRKMEQERRSYEEQIRQSEDEIRAEAGLLRMQRAELEEKMKRLEQQRDELSLRWKQNEILSHQQGETQGADINNLSRQQKELQETLRRVEKERDYLAEMMQEAERRAQKHTVALVTNLEDEKRKMAEVLKRMESEKAAQAQKVLVTKVKNFRCIIPYTSKFRLSILSVAMCRNPLPILPWQSRSRLREIAQRLEHPSKSSKPKESKSQIKSMRQEVAEAVMRQARVRCLSWQCHRKKQIARL